MVRLTPKGLSVSERQRAISPGEVFRRRLRQRGDEAERAGIGNSGDQFGAAHPLHAALHDRVLHADELGKSGFDHYCPLFPRARPRVFL